MCGQTFKNTHANIVKKVLLLYILSPNTCSISQLDMSYYIYCNDGTKVQLIFAV